MTNVKFNGVPFGRTLNTLVDDLFTEIPTILKTEVKRPEFKGFVPANILEKENLYEIELAVPGYEKSDFKINLDGNILSISAEVNNENIIEGEKVIRREFQKKSFKRTFTVNEKIDNEKIDAKYVNGLLIVSLNKKEPEKTASKNIEIQ